MKKTIFASLLLATSALSVSAQTEDENVQKIAELEQQVAALQQKEAERVEAEQMAKIWKRKKHFGIGLGNQTLTGIEGGYSEKVGDGFSINMDFGRSYFLLKKPYANILNFAIDAKWFDMGYSKYKSGSGGLDLNVETDLDDYVYGGGQKFDEDDILDNVDLGQHQMDVGMGIGLSVHAAPFYNQSNGLKNLRAYTYLHFTPSFSAILLTGGDETEVYTGFCPFFNWGIGVQWKALSLGFETRWGTATYKSNLEENDGYKPEFKTTSSRFVIRLCY